MRSHAHEPDPSQDDRRRVRASALRRTCFDVLHRTTNLTDYGLPATALDANGHVIAVDGETLRSSLNTINEKGTRSTEATILYGDGFIVRFGFQPDATATGLGLIALASLLPGERVGIALRGASAALVVPGRAEAQTFTFMALSDPELPHWAEIIATLV